MPRHEGGVKYLFNSRSGPVTISNNGVVRFWSIDNGALIREAAPAANLKLDQCIRLTSRAEIVCTYQNEKSFLITFTEQKTNPMIELDFKPDHLYANEPGNNLYLVKRDNGLLVDVLPLDDLKHNEGGRTIEIEAEGVMVLVPDDKLAYLNKQKQIESVNLLTGEINQIDFQLTPDCSLENHDQTDTSHVSDTLVFSCNLSLRFVISAFSEDHRLINTEGSLHRLGVIGQHHYALVRQSDKSFKLFNTLTAKFVELNYREHILSAWGDCFVSHSSELDFDCSILRHSAGDQVSMIQRGKSEPKWHREEALSNVASTLLVDLPPGNTVDVDPYTWTFTQRLQIQIQLLKAWLSTLMAELETGTFFTSPTRDPLVNEPGLIRDQFNLHKMIVIATQSGAVFGLDSLDGEILWTKTFPDMRNCAIHSVLAKDTNINYGIVAITAKCNDGSAHVVRLNPVNGDLVEKREDLKGNVLRVERMASMTADQSHPLLVISELDDKLNAEIIGDTTGIDADITEELESTYYWLVRRASGLVQGVKASFGGTVTETWAFQLPSNQRLVEVNTQSRPNIIHSQGKALADRSVLYKYMNPNLIAVIAESTEKDNGELMACTLYVLDGVTGSLIHTAQHKRARGPVKLVMAENWLVYSYWNVKQFRTEVTVVDFYLGQNDPNTTEWDSIDDSNSLPLAIQNSFILDQQVNQLGVSQSPRGITNKAILIATQTGQIYSMPKKDMFEPRRKLNAVASDRDEGILPYEPQIRLSPAQAVNYYRSVFDVSKFHVGISGIESTCVVFAVGSHDLFWTRIQASGPFDVLKDDFNHAMILLILAGFGGVTYACKRIAQLKMLKRLWQ